ncbi:MAG: hypothetical protein O0W93_06310 [Methanocorpusculum sp.]|nr:hypothetical protein [Methanocorpusculum sp.]
MSEKASSYTSVNSLSPLLFAGISPLPAAQDTLRLYAGDTRRLRTSSNNRKLMSPEHGTGRPAPLCILQNNTRGGDRASRPISGSIICR